MQLLYAYSDTFECYRYMVVLLMTSSGNDARQNVFCHAFV